MKILILTGSFGMGHNSTSQSIMEEIKKKYTDATIEILDIIDYCFPKVKNIIYGSFKLLVEKCPGIYNLSYKATEKKGDIHIEWIVFKKIEKMMREYSPDIIISTMPFAADSICYYKERTGMKIPHITCITDISIHSEWVTKNSDMYFVGSDETKKYLCNSGIKKDRVVITGIPVKTEFKNISCRKKYSRKKKVLIMGGGFGLIPFHKEILSELNEDNNIETTIITGHNRKLYHEVFVKYPNIRVVGFTNEVHRYMQESDVLISKPGGITLFEAIQSNIPMVVINPFLAQEIHNADFIERKQIGKIIYNKKDVKDQLYDFIYDYRLQDDMRKNMNSIKRKINRVEMAGIIGDLCEAQAV